MGITIPNPVMSMNIVITITKLGETRSLLGIASPYRTVYLPVLRSLLPEMYSTFDFPNPNQIK